MLLSLLRSVIVAWVTAVSKDVFGATLSGRAATSAFSWEFAKTRADGRMEC